MGEGGNAPNIILGLIIPGSVLDRIKKYSTVLRREVNLFKEALQGFEIKTQFPRERSTEMRRVVAEDVGDVTKRGDDGEA